MSILKVSIRQLKAARALIGWSQEELALAADVSLPTIKRLEAAEGWLAGRQTTAHKNSGCARKSRHRIHRRKRRRPRRAPAQAPAVEKAKIIQRGQG